MNIHEYQAKQLLKDCGVPVPSGYLVSGVGEVETAIKKIGTFPVVIKAQVHAGGRGKAGGISLAHSTEEAIVAAKKILGMRLINSQTGQDGKIVRKLYIESGSNIQRELYMSMIVDRNTSRITIIASSEGGMEIEEVAKNNPEKIIKISIDPVMGLRSFHVLRIASALGINKEQMKSFGSFVNKLYSLFIEKDASQIEINPLIINEKDEIIPLDAKFNFDDNALFRHKDIADMRDENEEDPSELEAAMHGLSYVKMDGSVGCMVNGAGLAMATMDIIQLYGASPANFLDVGGDADKDRVCKAFKIIIADPNVKIILINIFGGIMKCDVIAQGVIEAVEEIGLNIPVVVRLEGTNSDIGKGILDKSGLSLYSANNIEDAVKQVVKLLS